MVCVCTPCITQYRTLSLSHTLSFISLPYSPPPSLPCNPPPSLSSLGCGVQPSVIVSMLQCLASWIMSENSTTTLQTACDFDYSDKASRPAVLLTNPEMGHLVFSALEAGSVCRYIYVIETIYDIFMVYSDVVASSSATTHGLHIIRLSNNRVSD